MSTEQNKAVVQRMLFEVLVDGNIDLIDDLVAPDFINHNVIGTGEEANSVGVESLRQEVQAFRSAFPDVAIEIIHLLAVDDKVIAHIRSRYTHVGDFRGIAATGKRVNNLSISIVRLANGKFAERWNLVDRYAIMQQLGVIPS